MKTITELQKGVNKYWVGLPSNDLSSLEILAWHAASDLASFVEMTVEPSDFADAYPETYLVLVGVDEYFKSIRQLPPLVLAHVFLMVDRVNAGLTARGKDKKRPSKPTDA